MLEQLPTWRSLLGAFQKTSAEVLSQCAAENPLKNIVAAGADYSPQDGLGVRDRVWVSGTLNFCERQNIAVDKDVRVIPVNITNGQDILNPQINIPADILICCYIVDPTLFPAETLKKLREERGEIFNVSPYHTKTAWAEAAQRSGARLIITFNQYYEISSKDFLVLPGYVKGPEENHLITATDKNGKPGQAYFKMETVFREDLAQDFVRHHNGKRLKHFSFH